MTKEVNTGAMGAYVLHYGVADGSCNNATTQNRTVHVVDVVPSAITLLGQSEP